MLLAGHCTDQGRTISAESKHRQADHFLMSPRTSRLLVHSDRTNGSSYAGFRLVTRHPFWPAYRYVWLLERAISGAQRGKVGSKVYITLLIPESLESSLARFIGVATPCHNRRFISSVGRQLYISIVVV